MIEYDNMWFYFTGEKNRHHIMRYDGKGNHLTIKSMTHNVLFVKVRNIM